MTLAKDAARIRRLSDTHVSLTLPVARIPKPADDHLLLAKLHDTLPVHEYFRGDHTVCRSRTLIPVFVRLLIVMSPTNGCVGREDWQNLTCVTRL